MVYFYSCLCFLLQSAQRIMIVTMDFCAEVALAVSYYHFPFFNFLIEIYSHIFSGIDECSPKSSNWDGYKVFCCTSEQPCGELQGGCITDDQCDASLICTNSPYACQGFATASGERCCATSYYGKNTFKIRLFDSIYRIHSISTLSDVEVFYI